MFYRIFLALFLVSDKGAWVVPTPDGVWHRDPHYRRKFIGGVHKIHILIRALLEYFLRNFFGEEIGGSEALRPPNAKSRYEAHIGLCEPL